MSRLKNLKKIDFLIFSSVLALLIIQAIDKDGSYRLLQYLLLGLMIIGLIIYKFIRR
jgi:uncharacterized membrane protein YobD (UPF0266 family)